MANRNVGQLRARRRLANVRQDIARARAELVLLRAAISDARSDAGLAASQAMRDENRHLIARQRQASQDACASQVALDLAVHASQTDPLTGLRNRSVLRDRLSQALALAHRQSQQVGVILIDLDDFKRLNDERGHAAGDLALQHVAAVLTATVRSSDLVCRLGGDEFLVVASTAQRGDAVQLAAKISLALSETCVLAGQAVQLSASLGLSLYPDDGQTAESLVQRADEAMYLVKRARLAQVQR